MLEKRADQNWSMGIPEKAAAAPVTRTDTLKITTGPTCAGGLSAVNNIIGSQLRDLKKLVTDPMAIGGIKKNRTPRGKLKESRECK